MRERPVRVGNESEMFPESVDLRPDVLIEINEIENWTSTEGGHDRSLRLTH